jgi:hypothetical protein
MTGQISIPPDTNTVPRRTIFMGLFWRKTRNCSIVGWEALKGGCDTTKPRSIERGRILADAHAGQPIAAPE